MFLGAVVQLSSSSDAEGSVANAHALIREAAARGASLIVTPENTNFLGPHDEKVRRAETLDGPTARAFGQLANELRVHLVLGSFNERAPTSGKCYNTSVLFLPDGSVGCAYRKIHLFDVDCGPGVRFKESDTVEAGTTPTVQSTTLGTLGLSICYDLRFPELYRTYSKDGAEILTVPSAFTMTTGKDHWEPLLRARAIENQCYVMAAGQCGTHDDEGLRESYGHSMIVDPWGHVVAMCSDGPGVAIAEIDLNRIASVRQGMPTMQHRRLD